MQALAIKIPSKYERSSDMICKGCGRNNPEGQVTCFSCGTPLNSDSPANTGMGMGMGSSMAPNAYNPSPVPTRGFSWPTATAERRNIIGIIGAVIALIGSFLPFWGYDVLGVTDSLSLFADGWRGYIALVAAAAGISAALKGIDVGVLGAGCVVGLMGLLEYNMLDSAIRTALKKVGGAEMATGEYVELMKSFFHTGAGCYIVFVGAAVMIGGGVYGMVSSKR